MPRHAVLAETCTNFLTKNSIFLLLEKILASACYDLPCLQKHDRVEKNISH